MEDLPELPFENLLSYLRLEDRLRARAVSKGWRQKFDSYPVKCLCYSKWPSGFVKNKARWVCGSFAKNFISFPFSKFESFSSASVLSNLRHLRLCDLCLDLEDQTAFARILKSFEQLEALDIIRAKCSRKREYELNLPMLSRIHLENLRGIQKLTLDTPRLRTVKFVDQPSTSLPLLDIVHGESVESLFISDLKKITPKAMKSLVNLEYLLTCRLVKMNPTFLFSLKQLKEIHLGDLRYLARLFEQKQRYGRTDLKIFLGGLPLNGPDDPAIGSAIGYNPLTPEFFRHLTENSSRLADVIPSWHAFNYHLTELAVTLGSTINVLNRFTHFRTILIFYPIEDIEHFLVLLKNLPNIVGLIFDHDQPQELLDRLPEHCAVERLLIYSEIPDVRFLFALKNLIHLEASGCRFDAQSIRTAFEELPFLRHFRFKFLSEQVTIEMNIHPKRFDLQVGGKYQTVSDLNAAIEYIQENVDDFLE